MLFKDFRKPTIIFLCLPLAAIGIVFGMLISGKDFGFVAIVGALGLIGMMIKNGVVLLDEITLQIASGKGRLVALLDSSSSRFRPVMMASLTTILGMIPLLGDEYIVFTPYFPEYRVFIESAGAAMIETPADSSTFQIDFDRLSAAVTAHTKGVFVNSPNNPSGVVYTEENIQKLAAFLETKSAEYGHPIYLIVDEPYRELVYGDVEVPYLTKYYKNTLVCYSYSKSLSLPGERIGYVLVPDEVDDARTIYAAVCGAGRALGFVCAPSLIQHVIAKCAGQVSDLSVYKKNRDLLYDSLTAYGFTCVHPDGAFYLFMKTPEPDAYAFCEKAKKYELLLVPGDDFGAPGFVRIAYCVTTAQIARALPAFKELAGEYFA